MIDFELTDYKITSKQADRMMSSLELDLIAYYKILQEDVLKIIDEAEDTETIIQQIDSFFKEDVNDTKT